MRAAIFQLRYLDRIPAHAAVHDAVEWVKRRQRAASGLVNAVLRKVDRTPVAWPDEATELSCPAWLLERWSAHFGKAEARAIAKEALQEPGAYIRIPPGRPPAEGIELEATDVPGAFRVLSGHPGEAVRWHDISSQAIVPSLDLAAGQSYLDLCAAPGNKTIQALETPLRLAVACDVSLRRLREVPPLCPRVVLDATQPLPFGKPFDRVFVDVPCSGTGTVGRNPEIKWRVTKEDFDRFHEKQVQILQRAVGALNDRGKLLYASCSLEPEENEKVVAAILGREPRLRLVKEQWRLPGRDAGDGFYAAVLEVTR